MMMSRMNCLHGTNSPSTGKACQTIASKAEVTISKSEKEIVDLQKPQKVELHWVFLVVKKL